MSAPSGYLDLLSAARMTGMSVADLAHHTIVVAGESLIPESVARDLAEKQNKLGRAEWNRYIDGAIEGGQRKY